MEHITNREKEVMSLVAQGLTDKEIAAKLCVSITTIKTHVIHLYEKLGVHEWGKKRGSTVVRVRAVLKWQEILKEKGENNE